MKRVQGIRWDKVAQARAKIESGFYDDPAILRDIVRLSKESLVNDLNECPYGKENGDFYRDLVAEGFCKSLSDVIDIPLIRKEFSNHGGRIDLEFPLQYESLVSGSIWDRWRTTYDVRSILVEVKNLKTRSQVEDFRQLESYVRTADRGRLGVLVSRNGFAKNALMYAKQVLSSASILMLPLSGKDLCNLLTQSSTALGETLVRRRETLLVQMA